MADNTVVQTIKDAEIDARSLSGFVYRPASDMVERRLAPAIHTLNYYLEFLDGIPQRVEDAINGVIAVEGIGAGAVYDNQLQDNQENINKLLVSEANVHAISSVYQFPIKGNTKKTYLLRSFWEGKGSGGGVFEWSPTTPKTAHNGVSVIDPDKTRQLSQFGVYGNYFTPQSTGTGAYKRLDVTDYAYVEWAGVDQGISDNSVALQAVMDSFRGMKIKPGRRYYHDSTIVISDKMHTYIVSHGGRMYEGGALYYTGNGAQFKALESVGHIRLEGVTFGGWPEDLDYAFNAGSICFDMTEGRGTLLVKECMITRFETLFKSYLNSYYNKFTDNRFSLFGTGLDNFVNYNLFIENNRADAFNTFLKLGGSTGPTLIKGNSFEDFNGNIVRAVNGLGYGGGYDRCNITFSENYVEVKSNVTLPLGMPRSSEWSGVTNYPDRYGNNILFTGYYGTITIVDNFMHLNGVYRVGLFQTCLYLTVKRNTFTDFETGSALSAFITSAGEIEKIDIINNKIRLGGEGDFTATYSELALPVSAPYRSIINYEDPMTGATTSRSSRVGAIPIKNSWTIKGDTMLRVVYAREYTMLKGLVDGTNKTSNVITTLGNTEKPVGSNSYYDSILLPTVNSTNGEFVLLKYVYATGDIELVNTPSDTSSVVLDGLVIHRQ